MFRFFPAAAFCCAMLGGCVTMPTQENDGISIKRVVERVKCELGRAASKQPKLTSWIGNITLTLEVDQSGAVMPSTSLSGPFSAGTFGLEIGAGAAGKSIQTSLVTVYFEVYELIAFAEKCPVAPINQLEDSLGLQQWIERIFDLSESEGAVFKDKDKAIGYTLEFDLELSAGITPGFTFARANGKAGLSASRKTLNTLQVALADAGIVPPRTYITRKTIYPEAKSRPQESPEAKPSAAPNVTDDNASQAQPKPSSPKPKVVTKTVVVPGRAPSADGKRRLDAVIQRLYFNNLRVRP